MRADQEVGRARFGFGGSRPPVATRDSPALARPAVGPNCCCPYRGRSMISTGLQKAIQCGLRSLRPGQQLRIHHTADDERPVLSALIKLAPQRRCVEGMVVDQGEDIGISSRDQGICSALPLQVPKGAAPVLPRPSYAQLAFLGTRPRVPRLADILAGLGWGSKSASQFRKGLFRAVAGASETPELRVELHLVRTCPRPAAHARRGAE